MFKKPISSISKIKFKIFFISLFLITGLLIIANETNAGIFFNEETVYEAWGSKLKLIPDTNVKVGDQAAVEAITDDTKTSWIGQKLSLAQDYFMNVVLKKAGATAFFSTLRTALGQLAYDTANWVATSGDGQGPRYFKESLSKIASDAADNAAGAFIENLGKEGAFGQKFNLCEPDFDLKVSIGLGLVEQERPTSPDCSFSEMKNNWDKEMAELSSQNFAKKFQKMFDPTGSELVQTLRINTAFEEEKNLKKEFAKEQVKLDQGYKTLMGAAGIKQSPPGEEERRLQFNNDIKAGTFGKVTEDAFVDAYNIFLNQLAIKYFQRVMDHLSDTTGASSEGYNGDYGLSNYKASPVRTSVKSMQKKLSKLTEPLFNVRGDYDILAELAMCPDFENAGPTNCVIDDKFREAIQNNYTVGEAMKKGLLNPNYPFGFEKMTADGEMKDSDVGYKGSYPYRSMIILRKFRILPIGWEEAAKKAMVNNPSGQLNLIDLVSCFSDADEFNSMPSQPWCVGMVDPDWVLKAPKNYCKKEGPGSYIKSTTVMNGNLTVLRDEKYCADEQSCIKEKSDGSCEYYGYCSEERRKWNFENQSCDPYYNTCRTFTMADGGSISYLENTLNYDGCTADNAGCKSYCEDYNFDDKDFTCMSTSQSLFFDHDVTECDASSEGCHEFIRTKAGLNVNLISNGSFENITPTTIAPVTTIGQWVFTGSPNAQIIDSASGQAKSGNNSLYISAGAANIGLSSRFTDHIMPENFVMQDNNAYTISAWVYVVGAGQRVRLSIGDGTNWVSATTTTNGQWEKITVSIVKTITNSFDQFLIYADSAAANFYVDDIKLEVGRYSSAYSDYRTNGLIYEKLLPDYLSDECYIGYDNRLRNNLWDGGFIEAMPDAPADCNKYVRRCTAEESGCELYTAKSDGLSVPARITDEDYCPDECVGYNNYLQKETYFETSNPEYFIPKTAKKCSAEAVGCDEFTNLDELSRGGEASEYYTYMRQCVKNDNADCREFYTWEGSGETGYQLKVHSIQADLASGNPSITSPDILECNDSIYHLSPTDPSYNSDCREFYNTAGGVSYHLYSRTISCSDNCHPYRKTNNNIVRHTDLTDLDAAECALEGSGAYHDGTHCIVCRNGGTYDTDHNACIYNAIPGEGKKCTAASNGCREYSGSTGNLMKNLLNNDFEGSMQGWQGLTPPPTAPREALDIVNDSLRVGGHSLQVQITGGNAAAFVSLEGQVSQGESYYLSFMAKQDAVNSASSFNLIAIGSTTVDMTPFNIDVGTIGSDWVVYKFNLASLERSYGSGDRLIIQANGSFLIDDIRLVEIVDRYYLIKNSWKTPDVCMRDILGAWRGATFNLGCASYTDRDNKTYNLHDFSNICQESSVGCEMMIDTQNSTDYNHDNPNDNDGNFICNSPVDDRDCRIVGYDRIIYAVYDKNKFCNSADKGCQFLGETYQYATSTIFSDVYLKNDPDKYNNIMCSVGARTCEEWQTDEGASYFHDPGNEVCEYRLASTSKPSETNMKWMQKYINRCDTNSNGSIDHGGTPIRPIETDVCLKDSDCNVPLGTTECASDADCGAGGNNKCVDKVCHYACLPDQQDYDCYVDAYKTVGFGGKGYSIYQPTDQVGLCPAEQSGCTELIDPISQFSTNLVDSNAGGDIPVQIDTLYRIGGVPNNVAPYGVLGHAAYTVDCNGSVNILQSNNTFVYSSTGVFTLPQATESMLFYTDNSTVCNLTPGAGLVVSPLNIEVKKAVVDYQLSENLDKSSCNGVTNFSDGCVLFNERKQNGTVKSISVYDADSTVNMVTAPVTTGIANSNQLIKARPDRECNEWISCRDTYLNELTREFVCREIGNCTKLGPNGKCLNYVDYLPNPPGPQVRVFNPATDQNVSGYSKMDMFHMGDMYEYGSSAIVRNGDFETGSENGRPSNWTLMNEVSWTPEQAQIIHTVDKAEEYNISYPMEGRGLLRMGADQILRSANIRLTPGIEYAVSYYVNTQHLGNTANDAHARLRILWGDDTNPADYSDSDIMQGYHGWQTITNDFIPNRSNVRVYLQTYSPSAATLPSSGAVYYDNISIMPVLSITPAINNSVKRSCRIYPGTDRMSCDYFDLANGVVRGWYGYCLENDRKPGNKNTCLLWYPVDSIRGANVNEGTIGYDGKTPVYYCARMNANFNFVEKRVRRDVYEASRTQTNWFGILGIVFPPAIVASAMGTAIYANMSDNCEDEIDYTDAATAISQCDSDKYNVHLHKDQDVSLIDITCEVRITCIPKNDGGALTTRIYADGPAATDGWYAYDGNLAYKVGHENIDEGHPYFVGAAWSDTDTANGFTQPVMVYDYSLTTANNFVDPASYRLTCTEFYKVVEDDGTNKAWTSRVKTGSTYATPLGYDYEDEDAPFGSAIPPLEDGLVANPEIWDGDGSAGYQPIKFRENENETVVAGLPYGCYDDDTTQPTGCALIGRCETHDNILCSLTYPGDPGTSGSSEPGGDWKPSESQYVMRCPGNERCMQQNNFDQLKTVASTNVNLTNAVQMINRLFVENSVQVHWAGTEYDIIDPPTNGEPIIPPGAACIGAKTATSYCYVLPTIGAGPTGYIRLYRNGVTLVYDTSAGDTVLPNPLPAGDYSLRFTNTVDPDQLPLDRIDVNWGDRDNPDYSSVEPYISSNLSPNPDPASPRELTHYYDGTATAVAHPISIRIVDNWGIATCVRPGSACTLVSQDY